MKKASLILGIALNGFLAAASAAQAPLDTLRAAEIGRQDTAATDTSRSTAAAAEATPRTLNDLGTVDGGIRLAADLSERTLRVIGQDGTLRTFAVAVGSPSYPTPAGTYSIRKIVWNPSWIPPDSKWARKETAKGPGEPGNPMKVAKIFFREPDFYIHGTGDTKSLGKAASHGCLRMDPDEVAELAKFLMQNGGQAREEGWFSRIIHMRWKTHTVYLSQPITLTVTK